MALWGPRHGRQSQPPPTPSTKPASPKLASPQPASPKPGSSKVPKPGSCPGAPTAAVELITESEGFRSKAYPDPHPQTGGKPYTIGYGSTTYADGSEVQLGDTITKAEATKLLARFVTTSILPQLRKMPYLGAVNNNQRSALISFAHNLGPYFYFGGSRFSSITKVLNNKDWKAVPPTLYNYRSPGTSVERGLARRRKAEGALWTKPQGALSCS